jgi:hypothetical protein
MAGHDTQNTQTVAEDDFHLPEQEAVDFDAMLEALEKTTGLDAARKTCQRGLADEAYEFNVDRIATPAHTGYICGEVVKREVAAARTLQGATPEETEKLIKDRLYSDFNADVPPESFGVHSDEEMQQMIFDGSNGGKVTIDVPSVVAGISFPMTIQPGAAYDAGYVEMDEFISDGRMAALASQSEIDYSQLPGGEQTVLYLQDPDLRERVKQVCSFGLIPNREGEPEIQACPRVGAADRLSDEIARRNAQAR